MRPHLALALLALVGCTTYGLHSGDPDHSDPEEDWDDTAVWGDTCPDKSYDAWQTSGSAGCMDGDVALADLTLSPAGRCEVDCDEDRVVLWVHPGNRGRTDLSGARVVVERLMEGEREELEVRELEGTLRQLWYEESEQFDLSGYDLEDADAVIFRIESDLQDCDETNDEHNELGPFCD